VLRPLPRVPPVVRFAVALDESLSLTNGNTQSLGISSDGTRIAFVGNRQVYVRSF